AMFCPTTSRPLRAAVRAEWAVVRPLKVLMSELLVDQVGGAAIERLPCGVVRAGVESDAGDGLLRGAEGGAQELLVDVADVRDLRREVAHGGEVVGEDLAPRAFGGRGDE